MAALQINLPVLMEISVLNRGKDVTKDKIAGEIGMGCTIYILKEHSFFF